MEKQQHDQRDPIMEWYEVCKHSGDQHWTEMKSIADLSPDEFYDLWEGDRI